MGLLLIWKMGVSHQPWGISGSEKLYAPRTLAVKINDDFRVKVTTYIYEQEQHCVDWTSVLGPVVGNKKHTCAFQLHHALLLATHIVPSPSDFRALTAMQEEKGEMFFKSLKTFLWNGGKSITRWIRALWGADCCRQTASWDLGL